MRILLAALGLVVALCSTSVSALHVKLVFDSESPQASYAARKLTHTLDKQDHKTTQNSENYDLLINLDVDSHRFQPESFSIFPEAKSLNIIGGDNRGLIYGALDVVEQLENGITLENIKASQQQPAMEFRGIKFNLPWETYRPSSALDQHYDTVRDIKYWEAFLDMMVANRFNVVSLWNMHPYTFMVQPKNFPEASPWSKRELKQWQSLYHQIFTLAKERALDTYIVHWNIFVSEKFAKAHNVAAQNFYPHYYVPGDTSELVKRYIRESVTQVLEEYPNLDGIGISHGEGMAGMTPLQRQQWVDEVLIPGMLDADRPVKLIHRVPFSSGKSSDPGVSKNVEQVTRSAMEKLDDAFQGPIWVEMKFNWSHGHSTPRLEKVHGGKLGETYFKPLPKNYKVVWQVRNEDFFALRWGVPNFIRQHIALNGQASYVGGYFVGSETYIPALDYFTAVKGDVDWQWAFQRQWLFYKLWGRLLYNPDTPDSLFQQEFVRRYGEQSRFLLQAYSLASNTQLRLASLFDASWDFTLYSEGFMALQGDTTRYISVADLMQHPTMASDFISVADYVETLAQGGDFGAGKTTPPMLADMLERDNGRALKLIKAIKANGNLSLRYELADVEIWANLGLHLAAKIRAAVALKNYQISGDQQQQSDAIQQLNRALAFWDKVIEISRPLYKDMRLTHLNHGSFDANENNFFHWALIRDQVAADIAIAQTMKTEAVKADK